MAKPHNHGDLGFTMLQTNRTRHKDHPVDQFGTGARRHRLVKRVERGLVKSLAFDERGRHGFPRRAIGHEANLSSQERDSNRVAVTRDADR